MKTTGILRTAKGVLDHVAALANYDGDYFKAFLPFIGEHAVVKYDKEKIGRGEYAYIIGIGGMRLGSFIYPPLGLAANAAIGSCEAGTLYCLRKKRSRLSD